jgi:hypothetical protein
MAAADCPDEQSSDPLKKFVDESPEFKELESIGTSTGRILYPPNTRMKDFSGNILLLLSNFVPIDDKSIFPKCFFTLGKEGRPNQTSILMPMRVLGKCMCRYQNFSNDNDAILSNLDTVILTNCTFFGGPKDWCCEKTDNRCASYNELAKKSDPIVKAFHVSLCEKITQDGGNYSVVLFGDHAWSACANWFPAKKVINRESIAHGSVIRNNWHRENARDAFLVTVDRASTFLSGAVPIPFVDSEKSHFLHIGNDPNIVRSTTRKEMQLQQDPEERTREEEERVRKKEERARKKEEECRRKKEERAMKKQEAQRKLNEWLREEEQYWW